MGWGRYHNTSQTMRYMAKQFRGGVALVTGGPWLGKPTAGVRLDFDVVGIFRLEGC